MSLASLLEGILVIFAIAIAFVASSATAALVARRMKGSGTVDRSVGPTAPVSANSDIAQASSFAGERDGISTGIKAEFGPATRKVG
jgi:hypothetical protein